jgi:hypothetical protein
MPHGRFPSHLFIALVPLVMIAMIAGCGMTVRPHMGVPGAERPGDERLGPLPAPGGTADEDGRPAVDRICRARGTPSGYVIIAYEVGGRECPSPPDAGMAYTVAVIERHDRRPVGSQMAVCADQRVPRGWVRQWTQDDVGECPGARVAEDAPSRIVIRRTR